MRVVKQPEKKNSGDNWLGEEDFMQFGTDWLDKSFFIRRTGKAFLAPEQELTS